MGALKNITDQLIDIPLDESDFLYFQSKIFNLAGINLTHKKFELVKTRLRNRLVALNLKSYTDYKNYLDSLSPQHLEWQKFINVLTTNKTDFFREPAHFDFLQNNYLKNHYSQFKNEELKIWSCASSTGEEPYTIALVLKEFQELYNIKYKILASDIDTQVLAIASNGVYPEARKNEIPTELFSKHCIIGKHTASGWFKIKEDVKNQIEFTKHNLNSDELISDEAFDIIFCRNVMIYFNHETIVSLLEKLHKSLKEGGILFIGHSENIHGCNHLFKSLAPSILKKT